MNDNVTQMLFGGYGLPHLFEKIGECREQIRVIDEELQRRHVECRGGLCGRCRFTPTHRRGRRWIGQKRGGGQSPSTRARWVDAVKGVSCIEVLAQATELHIHWPKQMRNPDPDLSKCSPQRC
jgi:hypothetical protein